MEVNNEETELDTMKRVAKAKHRKCLANMFLLFLTISYNVIHFFYVSVYYYFFPFMVTTAVFFVQKSQTNDSFN